MTSSDRLHWLQRGLFTIGLLLLVGWSQIYFEARGFQSAASRQLLDAIRLARPVPSAGNAAQLSSTGPIAPMQLRHAAGDARSLGRLEMPRLGISVMIAEGSDLQTLRWAVGHIPTTAGPGEAGNCALAGHRDTFLRRLRDARVNDVVRIVTIERTYDYRVAWTRVVEPQQVEVLDSTATRSLTLVTCYPFAFVGHAPRRFIVRAVEATDATRDPMARSRARGAPASY